MGTKMSAFTIAMVAIVSMLLTGTSFANSTSTGPRYIQQIGCHLTDEICYVTISGGAVGPAACRSDSIRWKADAPNGQSVLALLTSAFANQKRVHFAVHEDYCFAPQPQYPTFWYIIVDAN